MLASGLFCYFISVVNITAILQKSVELNDPIKNCEHQPPGSFSKTATSEQNLMNSCEYREGRSSDNPLLNSICQVGLLAVDVKVGAFDVCLSPHF